MLACQTGVPRFYHGITNIDLSLLQYYLKERRPRLGATNDITFYNVSSSPWKFKNKNKNLLPEASGLSFHTLEIGHQSKPQ